MKRNNFFSAKNVTALAVLLALVIVLQAFGGSFNIGIADINTYNHNYFPFLNCFSTTRYTV